MPIPRQRRPRPRPGRPVRPAEAESWLDEDAGPVVRPYVMTGGRVEPAVPELDLVAYVVALHGVEPEGHLQPEHQAILGLVARPMSLVEVAAHLDLPLGVVRVLIGDLLADGLVAVHEPAIGEGELPDEELLVAVLDGLRSL